MVLGLVRAAGGNWLEAGSLTLFGICFGGIAAAVMASAVRARRRLVESERTKAERPGEPWMWRPDWASGRIESGSKKQMAFAVFIALVWNAIAMPAPFLAWRDITEEGEKGALLVFIFPVVGM